MRHGQAREAGHTQLTGCTNGRRQAGSSPPPGGSGILISFGEQEEGDVCSLNRRQLPGPCCDPALTALHLFRFFAFLEDKGRGGEGREAQWSCQEHRSPSTGLLLVLLGRGHRDYTGTRPVTHESGVSAAWTAPAAGQASARCGGRGRQRPEHTENGRTPRQRSGPLFDRRRNRSRGHTGQSSSESRAYTPICRALKSPLLPLSRKQ